MNSQLLWITNLLQKKIPDYFIDGGSLLGLMREGNLLNHDNDIDICIWSEEEHLLKELIPDIKKKGYIVYILAYKGVNFKYKLVKKNEKLVIDVSILRKHQNHGWYPQPLQNVKKQNKKTKKKSKKSKKLIHRILGKLNRNFMKAFRFKDFNKFPWKNLFRLETWWIPLDLIEELTFNEKFGLKIPKNWEDYLSFRYGNWKVPNTSWCFWIDDKALRHEFPQSLFEN